MEKPEKSKRILIENGLEYIIFASRWLQAPLYFGLIIVQLIYTYKFIMELIHIVGSAQVSTELQLLLGILSLVDFTMVANLVAMVIIGGYATFVSKLNLDHHDDKPDWLDHIDPGAIKVKLASSLLVFQVYIFFVPLLTLQKQILKNKMANYNPYNIHCINRVFSSKRIYYVKKTCSLTLSNIG